MKTDTDTTTCACLTSAVTDRDFWETEYKEEQNFKDSEIINTNTKKEK
jgi:hypothetical protein